MMSKRIIKYLVFFIMVFIFSACSYKVSDFKPASKKDTIFYDLSEDAHIDRSKKKYGSDWRNHI